MQCAACGRENSQDAGFCGGCGAKLTAVAPPDFDFGAGKAEAPAPDPPAGQQAQRAAPAGVCLVCIGGPDAGKRMMVGALEILIGRSTQCGLLSDDPDLGEKQAALFAQNGQIQFRSLAPAPIFVNGVALATGSLAPGSQMRIGRSFWQIEATPAKASAAAFTLLDRVGDRVSAVTGVSKVEGLNAREMFADVLQKRGDEDIEEYALAGTSAATPDLKDISAAWPRPWLFFKTFTAAVGVYLGFWFALNQFQNLNLLPGLIVVGGFAIPISVVIFYFEMNTPRNVSLYQVFKMLVMGGILSLIATLFLGAILRGGAGNILAAMLTGITEETGKVLALLLVVNKNKYRWTLNGLLLGGAVGAGFAGFESAGYAFTGLLQTSSTDYMGHTILLRGLLAPGGHVAWTALCGAALWKVKGSLPFDFKMVQDSRFLRVFGLAIVLHGLWDTDIPLPFYMAQVAFTVVAWIAISSFIQDGLKQIQTAQAQEQTS